MLNITRKLRAYLGIIFKLHFCLNAENKIQFIILLLKVTLDMA